MSRVAKSWVGLPAMMLLLGLADSGWADTVTLPAMTCNIAYIQASTSCNVTVGGFESYSTGGSDHGTATIFMGSDPYLYATVTSVADINSPAYNDLATIEAQFEFELSGPAGQLVPLIISASGSASRTSVLDEAEATLEIDSPFTGLSCTGGHPGCVLFLCADAMEGVAVCPLSSFSYNATLSVEPNEVYDVTELLDASGASTAEGTGTAELDPLIVISPSFPNASQYDLAFSSGFPIPGSIPEPGTFGFSLIAILALASARRRPAPCLRRKIKLLP